MTMIGSCDGDGRMVCLVLVVVGIVDVEVVGQKLVVVDVSLLVSNWSLVWSSKPQR